MIICLCRTLTKKDIEKEIVNGCETFEQLMEKIKASDECGTCHTAAKKIFNKLKKKHKKDK